MAVPAAQAAITIDTSPGTGAPPAMLGPYAMTSFHPDAQALFTLVPSVASPQGGALSFGPDLWHVTAGNGWATWSNGYIGDVYATTHNSNKMTDTLTLPPFTAAFYFYAEPEEFATLDFTVTAQDGTTTTVPVNGHGGARYFGLYATGGSTLSAITVSSDDPDGFAMGEFGIAGGASVLLAELAGDVVGVGPGHSLAAKVANAQRDYAGGDTASTCGLMGAFINEVSAQSGKHISPATAQSLIALAQQIETLIPCSSSSTGSTPSGSRPRGRGTKPGFNRPGTHAARRNPNH